MVVLAEPAARGPARFPAGPPGPTVGCMLTSPVNRPRTVALRVVVALFLAVGLLGLNVVLLFPLIGWLPAATLVQLGYPAEDTHHLVHGAGIGVGYSALLLCVAVQLRRPAQRVAPLWLGAFLLAGQILFDLVRWSIDDPIWFVPYGLYAAMVLLHPRRSARITAVHRPALLLAVAGAVPLAVYGVLQLRQQFGPVDPTGHVDANHYYGMAAAAGVTIVAALLGSTDLPGRLLTAWIAGVAAVLLGVSSIAHPGLVSAWPTGWAVAAVAWGGTYVALAHRSRTATGRRRAPAAAPTAGTAD